MELTTTVATADDDTRLAVHLTAATPDPPTTGTAPVMCLPGGPLLDSDYLGDLGGLAGHRRLALLDHRGTGRSEVPTDPTTYRCDRMVDDVEAVRRHLGLETVDLLAHSAGANLAHRYAERHPDRVASLLLVTPSVVALGIAVPDSARSEVARLRRSEPWYAAAAAGLAAIQAGTGTAEDGAALAPLSHGRWDAGTRAYAARMDARRDPAAIEAHVAEGAFDPPATRRAITGLDVPVLVVAGAWDIGAPPSVLAEVAGLFPRGRLVVLPRAGHFPWRDDASAFRTAVAPFLTAARPDSRH